LKDGAATMTTDTSSVSGGMMDDDDVMEEDQEQEDGELWTMGESFWCSLCDDGGNLLLYVAKLLIIVIATSSHAYHPLHVVPKKKSTVDFGVLQSSFGFLRRDDENFACLGVSSLSFFVPIATEPLLVDQLVTSF